MTRDAHAVVSARGARRWQGGHPWIFRSDIVRQPAVAPGAVAVRDQQGRALGWALWSPTSEIALRLLDRSPEAAIDATWWHEGIARAVARRAPLARDTTAYRLVHGEGDGLPSLIADRYDRWVVVQLLSAGAEAFRAEIVAALRALTGAEGILARHDVSVRAREGLERAVEPLWGVVPEEIEVVEHGVRYVAAPHTGQKTGAFLDQRENRVLAGGVARGRALDLFSYHGSFALHLAPHAEQVTAVDSSAAALERASENAALNGLTNVSLVNADVFDFLRARVKEGARFDTIVLDPPAFAKNRASLEGAVRGYRDVNLHAMRLLAGGGLLFTASCSYHLTKAHFLEMLRDAADDAGRRMILRALTAQPLDHPEVVTIPETGYLKGALLEAGD
ncbi:MAG TPA: class I SAM-dependent rRNA methyltransferase [Gemmatimonadaceae bacterium]|nr:class I SAM-dependent rRNA methyltransferase [Gemmatimonadaceae bacterium]